MTFEVLRLARTRGAAVHCIVNTWGSRAIVDMADSIDASWSTGYYWHRLERRVWHPLVAVRLAWDVLCTSAGLLRDAHRVAASAVLLPDHTTLLRNWPALLWLRFTGTRIVHRLGTPPEEGEGYRRLWRWAIAPVPHALVCNSAFTARALVAHDVPARKVMVAPNVLPAGRHQARVTGAPVPGRIVYAGQIIPGKGVHLLIEAVDRLVRGGFDVSLDVAGDIDGWESPTWRGYRARLRAQAAPLGARVRFLGWQADVPALLQAAWVHAAPSLPEIREGFGVVVLEAKAAGVPSVVGPSGALPELINEGVDGSVMPEATAGALADALVRWLDPAVRAAGSAAARRSLARWSPARFAETWDHAFGWTGVLQGALESRPCR
jgi:glycosyltransferase involved in cell wall biosynthesis